MRISTKGQYALSMMLDLAINNTGEYISIKSIAARQSLPEKYLEQIMIALSKAGYVKSIRGFKGGYQLAYEIKNYTVGMILRRIENSTAIAPCLEEECPECYHCVFYEVWKEINDAVNAVIDNISLEDLVLQQQMKAGNDYII